MTSPHFWKSLLEIAKKSCCTANLWEADTPNTQQKLTTNCRKNNGHTNRPSLYFRYAVTMWYMDREERRRYLEKMRPGKEKEEKIERGNEQPVANQEYYES